MKFTVVIGGKQIYCGISRGALLEACNSRHMRDCDFLPSFHRFRARIEAIAAAIFAERPAGVAGTLNIWADDFIDPPGAPSSALRLAHAGHA